MITTCPHCDSLVPMNVELAVKSQEKELNCPCCNMAFDPFTGHADLIVEDLKDRLVIEKSLQNIGRWFEDC